MVSQAASFLIQMAGTIVLARLLTPVDFGLIAMVTTFSLLFQNFGINGVTEAIIQREEIDHPTTNSLFWVNTGISCSLTLVFIALAPLIAGFFREPQLVFITVVVSLSIISGGLQVIPMALLQRNMQFSVTSKITVVARLVSTALAIFFAWIGLKYWSLVINTIAYPLTAPPPEEPRAKPRESNSRKGAKDATP